MNTRDEQSSLLLEVSEAWDRIDNIVDKRIGSDKNSQNLTDLKKSKAGVNVEADVAEVGLWLGNYLQNPKAEYRNRIFASADECLGNLALFRSAELTQEDQRAAGEVKTVFDQAIARVAKILDLNDSLIEDRRRFIQLRDQLDNILDDEIQAVITADMENAKAEAERVWTGRRTISFPLQSYCTNPASRRYSTGVSLRPSCIR